VTGSGRIPLVRDFLGSDVKFVAPDVPLQEVVDMMQTKAIRHLPVVADGKPVGVVTLSDIHILENVLGVDPEQLTVGEVMTKELATVPADEPLSSVAQTMRDRKIGSVIVLNGEALEGVFTATDAIRALASLELRMPD